MINGIIISRKVDGLIFCEVYYENNDKNFMEVRNEAQKFLKTTKKEKIFHGNINFKTYVLYYKINENIVYLIITHNKYPIKLAFCFLDEINKGFEMEIKNQFSNQNGYKKLEEIDKANYFSKFEKYIKKKIEEYLVKDNKIERINKEISDVYEIMAKNLNLIMDRDRTLKSISQLSEIIKNNSGKYKDITRKIRLRMLIVKFAILIGIGLLLFFIILFKILF